LLDEEGNGVVVHVEEGWVLSHEDVSNDEVVESFWELHGLDTQEALSLSELGHLEDVVGWRESVVSSIEVESDFWEGVEVGAVLLDSDSVDELVGEVLWSDQEGSSGVNDGQVSGGVNVGGSLSHGGEVDGPVGFLDDLVDLDTLEEVLFVGHVPAWNVHVGWVWKGSQVEGEGFSGRVFSSEEGWELVDRDGVVGKSEDSAHLSSEEGGTLDGGDFTESEFSVGNSTEGNSVLGNCSLDGSRSVLDIEGLSVSFVGRGFLGIESLVSPAGSRPALLGVNPEVGGSSIWNNGEGLSWGSNVDVGGVLGVHLVVDINVGSLEHLLSHVLEWSSSSLVEVALNVHMVVSEVDSSGHGHADEGSKGEFHI